MKKSSPGSSSLPNTSTSTESGLFRLRKQPRCRKFLWALPLSVLICVAGLNAQSTWNGSVSSDWNDDGNWSAGVPDSNELAVFNSTSSVTAGPINEGEVEVGAIWKTAGSAQTITPLAGATGTSVILRGYSVDLGAGPVNLLVGNTSSAALTFTNLASNNRTTTTITSSGVIHAAGDIYMGFAIGESNGSHKITKTGSGLLYLGDARISNTVQSTFTGGFEIVEGTVQTHFSSTYSAADGWQASPFGFGTLTLTGGTLTAVSGTARTYHNAVALNGSVTLGQTTGGVGAITFSSAAGNATTILRDSTLRTLVTTTFSQNISGSYGLTKTGAGTLILSGTANSYSGDTVVSEGVMYINGTTTATAFEVEDGATLGGSGSILNRSIVVKSGGTLTAGTLTTRGTLTTNGNITLEAGSKFRFDIASAISFDKIYAQGLVSLGGADLQIELTYQPTLGTVFLLVENAGVDPITGFLSYNGQSLADDSIFLATSGSYSQRFRIDYNYTNGTVSGLALTAVPEPQTMALVALGLMAVITFRSRRNRAVALDNIQR